MRKWVKNGPNPAQICDSETGPRQALRAGFEGTNILKILFKILLTPPSHFERLTPHTEQTIHDTMKTKSLLLTAALSAAGIASSLAQVYSVNVVGYINVDIQPGLNLVTAQLTGTNNSINTVLATTTPVMSDNSLLFPWNSGAQTFNNAQVYGSGQWYDPDTGALSTATISPGQAAFINNEIGR